MELKKFWVTTRVTSIRIEAVEAESMSDIIEGLYEVSELESDEDLEAEITGIEEYHL